MAGGRAQGENGARFQAPHRKSQEETGAGACDINITILPVSPRSGRPGR